MRIYCLVFLFSFSVLEIHSQVNLDSIRMERMMIRDTLFLANTIHDSLIYIHSNGLVETKNDFLHSIQFGTIQYTGFSFINRRTILQNKYNRVYRGNVLVKGIYHSTPFEIRLHFTSIYRKQKNIWKLLYWQSTKLKD